MLSLFRPIYFLDHHQALLPLSVLIHSEKWADDDDRQVQHKWKMLERTNTVHIWHQAKWSISHLLNGKLTFLNVGTRVHSFIFLQEFTVTSEACCGCCRLRYSEIISVSFVFNVFCWYGVCWCATGVFFLPYWLQITLFLLNTPININNQPNHWSKFTSASLKSLTHTPCVTKSDHDRGSWCSGWWAGHLPIKSLVEQSPPPSVHVLKHHWVRYSTLISPESFLR